MIIASRYGEGLDPVQTGLCSQKKRPYHFVILVSQVFRLLLFSLFESQIIFLVSNNFSILSYWNKAYGRMITGKLSLRNAVRFKEHIS